MKSLKLLVITILLSTLSGGVLSAQNLTVSGTVTDAITGEAIIGATVLVKGSSTQYTMTDYMGEYSLSAPSDGVLEISVLGYVTSEVPINGRSTINVQLSTDVELLADVVVVAYGTATRESLTGAVSTVKSESIEKRPVSSAAAALEGSVAGVQINNAYGEPGEDATIRIRGFNSISGSNSPLIVLDGVPMGDGSSISDINPSDISSISVLKDASSAALYGNRAANGVVLITTKSGSIGEEKLSMNLNIKQGMYTRGVAEYDRLDSVEYMEAFYQAIRNGLYTSTGNYTSYADAHADAVSAVSSYLAYNIFNKDWSELYDTNGKIVSDAYILPGIAEDLDWYQYLERVGYRQEYNMNASGGSKKSSYFMSMGYTNEQGFMRFSDGERFTGRANISVQPVKWLKVGTNISGAHNIYHRMTASSSDSGSYVNPFMFARRIAPIYPVHLHDLTTGDYILDADGNKQYDGGDGDVIRPQFNSRHVIWENELNQQETTRTTLNGAIFAEIKFLRDFTFRVNGNMTNRNTLAQTYNNAVIGDGAGLGRMSQTEYAYKNYTFQQQLTWNRDFDRHNVDVLLAHENYWYRYNYTYLYKTDEIFAGQMNLSNFNTLSTMTGYDVNYRTESYLGRVKYNYDDKYYLEGSFRRDGSSRFYYQNRWGNFWSIGGSWILTRESFMSDFDWVNMLKLRAAYGEVGQDEGADYYAWQGLYYITQNGGSGAAYKSQLEATDISWETSQSASVALEGRLFNRWNFILEFFNKTSKGLLYDVTLPSSMGSTGTSSSNPTQIMNFGSVQNLGLEFTTDVDVIRTKDWNWNVGLTLTTFKNTILQLPDQYSQEGQVSDTKKYMIGHSIYDFWLYQYQGVDLSDGHSLYTFDSDNYYIIDPGYTGSAAQTTDDTRTAADSDSYRIIDGTVYATKTTYAKKDWAGSAIPDVYGSFNTSLKWKNLTFSALMTFQIGGKIYDYSYYALMGTSTTPGALHVDNLKAWTPDDMGEGISTSVYPALNYDYYTDNFASYSSFFLIDASYLVLKNLSIYYDLPQRFANKLQFAGISVGASCENVVTLTRRKGMNPQQSFNGLNYNSYVPARVFSLDINVKF